MPDFYGENEYDLAGFAVGIVEKDSIIDGSEISVGDQIIGLASNGLHSNGYSLVRRIIFQEILPNALAPVLVAATFGVARAILVESTMSFLGLGDITVPSWGQILSTGATNLIKIHSVGQND